MKLNAGAEAEFDFGQDQPEGTARRRRSISPARSRWANAPMRRARVRTPMDYVCEKAVGPSAHLRLSGPARSSCSSRSNARRCRSCCRRQDRSAAQVHLEEGPAVQGLPGGEGRQAWASSSSRARARRRRAAKEGSPKRLRRSSTSPASTLGKCPKCGKRVFEVEDGLRVRGVAGRQEAVQVQDQQGHPAAADHRAQAPRLLKEGKTDLLHKFISTSRASFSAYLVMDDAGKVTFEFPERGMAVAQTNESG